MEHDDVQHALIFDLGAGTGRFSIASAFLGADLVLSIDIDFSALKILKENILSLELDHIIFPICTDVSHFELSLGDPFEKFKKVTIMNPPFGVQSRSADRFFLEKAFSFSDVIYSIHLSGEKIRNFIRGYIEKFNWKIDNVFAYNMILEKSFNFHTKKAKIVDVDVYRFIKK